jgi:hypothetical protein
MVVSQPPKRSAITLAYCSKRVSTNRPQLLLCQLLWEVQKSSAHFELVRGMYARRHPYFQATNTPAEATGHCQPTTLNCDRRPQVIQFSRMPILVQEKREGSITRYTTMDRSVSYVCCCEKRTPTSTLAHPQPHPR